MRKFTPTPHPATPTPPTCSGSSFGKIVMRVTETDRRTFTSECILYLKKWHVPWQQIILWINYSLFPIGFLRTYFSRIWIKIRKLSCKKKIPSKLLLFCFGVNVLTNSTIRLTSREVPKIYLYLCETCCWRRPGFTYIANGHSGIIVKSTGLQWRCEQSTVHFTSH